MRSIEKNREKGIERGETLLMKVGRKEMEIERNVRVKI